MFLLFISMLQKWLTVSENDPFIHLFMAWFIFIALWPLISDSLATTAAIWLVSHVGGATVDFSGQTLLTEYNKHGKWGQLGVRNNLFPHHQIVFWVDGMGGKWWLWDFLIGYQSLLSLRLACYRWLSRSTWRWFIATFFWSHL